MKINLLMYWFINILVCPVPGSHAADFNWAYRIKHISVRDSLIKTTFGKNTAKATPKTSFLQWRGVTVGGGGGGQIH